MQIYTRCNVSRQYYAERQIPRRPEMHPEFPPVHTWVETGQAGSLSCKVSSEFPPEVHWLKRLTPTPGSNVVQPPVPDEAEVETIHPQFIANRTIIIGNIKYQVDIMQCKHHVTSTLMIFNPKLHMIQQRRSCLRLKPKWPATATTRPFCCCRKRAKKAIPDIIFAWLLTMPDSITGKFIWTSATRLSSAPLVYIIILTFDYIINSL